MTEVARLETTFTGTTTGFDAALTHVKGSLNDASVDLGKKLTSVGDGITKVGMTFLPAALAVGGALTAGINTASSFDSIMAEISARTGTVGEDLTAVSELALQMGADTAFSANEAGEALLQLLSSGQSLEQAMQTLPIVLDLAAASGEDLGSVADWLTDIMASFNLEISAAADVADTLAQAAGASSADIGSLAQGFANVGPVARAFGLDVETTAAALAVLAENGIKGSEAGTALKSMLLNMTRDTEDVTSAWNALGTSFYDAEGNARPLPDVLASIKMGLEGMPIEDQNRLLQDLAGSYGIVAMQALLGDLTITNMKESMSVQADAASVAAARMDTFAGAMDSLGGSVETLQIRAFTPFMNNTLKPFIVDATEAINKVAEWAGKNPELSNSILSLGAAFVGLVAGTLVVGKAISIIGSAISLLQGAATLAIPGLGGVTLGLVALGGVAVAVGTNMGGARDKLREVTAEALGFDFAPAWRAFEIVTGLLQGDLGPLGQTISDVTYWALNFSFSGAWTDFKNTVADIAGSINAILGAEAPTSAANVMPGATAEGGMTREQAYALSPSYAEAMFGYDPYGISERDSGGRGAPGQAYKIGIGAQPEVFIPDSAGSFYPAGSYGSGGGQTVVQFNGNIYTQAQDGRALWEQLQVEARKRNVVLGVTS